MNVLKNFEALFVVTLGLACAANYVLDTSTVPEAQPLTASAALATDIPVVVVSAKRMSAEQKAQSLLDERKASASIQATENRI
jgi:acid phosphatase class B